MITNISKNAHVGKGDIAKFTKYLFTLQHEQEEITERLDGWYNEMSPSLDTMEEVPEPEQLKAFAEGIMSFNDQMKHGRKLTDKSRNAIMGHTSFSPDDKVTPAQALAIVKEATLAVIPGKRPRLFVCHIDKDHIHVHFVIGTVDTTGQYFNPVKDGLFRSFEHQNELAEIKYDLVRVAQRQSEALTDASRAVWVSAPHSVDIQQTARTGEATPDLILRAKVTRAFDQNKGNFDGFLDDLTMDGVRVMPAMSKDPEGKAKCSGLTFALAGSPMEHGTKASTIGRKYGWNNLSKELNYEQDRHSTRLGELRHALTNAKNERSNSLTSGLDSQPSLGAIEQNPRTSKPSSAELATGHSHTSDHSNGPSIATLEPVTRTGEHRHSGGASTPDGLHSRDHAENGHAGGADRGQDDSLRDQNGEFASQNGQDLDGDGHGQQHPNHSIDGITSQGHGQTDQLVAKDANRGLDAHTNHGGANILRVAALFGTHSTDSHPDRINNVGASSSVPHRSVEIVRETTAQRLRRTSWEEQHKALNADAYQINVVDRVDGSNRSHRVFAKGLGHDIAPQYVVKNLAYLASENAQGRDIYITPLYADKHSVLVDDLTTEKLAALRTDGYTPNLIQQSSDNNIQAVFVIPKHPAGGDISKNAANRFTNFLNKKFGDPKLNGCDHTFRMAGFQNKKVNRNNERTTVLSTFVGVCTKAVAGFRLALEMNAKEATIELDKRIEAGKQATTKALTAFGRHWKKHEALWKGKGSFDASAVDFNAAVDTFKEVGRIKAKEIVYDVAADMDARVKADGRKHADDYALKTTKKALGRAQGDDGEDAEMKPKGPKGPKSTSEFAWLNTQKDEIKHEQGGMEI